MYNLYPQFVDLNEKQEHTAILCGSCYTAVSKGHIPLHSLAGGVDFGSTLSLGLEPLTVVEELCLAHGRPYMTIVKLSGSQPEERQSASRGHVFTVPQSNEALTAEILKMKLGTDGKVFPNVNDISRYFGIVFVGGRPQWDALIASHYSQMPEIQVNATRMYQWLRALKILNPNYKNIVIDDSDEMTSKINAIPSLLLKQVDIVDGKMESQIENILEQQNLSSDEVQPAMLPLQSAFLTRSYAMPTSIEQSGIHVLTSNIITTSIIHLFIKSNNFYNQNYI